MICDSLRKLQFSKFTPKKFVESAHTKPRRSMIAICFGIHLSFTMSSMLCVQGLPVLHNKHFESTLLSSNISPILFEFYDLQYVHSIQYGTTLHSTEYCKRPERQRLSRTPRAINLDNSRSWAKKANLWLMLNCNLFSFTLSPASASCGVQKKSHMRVLMLIFNTNKIWETSSPCAMDLLELPDLIDTHW